jgi:hypothetical protein
VELAAIQLGIFLFRIARLEIDDAIRSICKIDHDVKPPVDKTGSIMPGHADRLRSHPLLTVFHNPRGESGMHLMSLFTRVVILEEHCNLAEDCGEGNGRLRDIMDHLEIKAPFTPLIEKGKIRRAEFKYFVYHLSN